MSPPLAPPPFVEDAIVGFQSSAASETLLPLALAVITFGMGLGLVADDFRRVFTMPRAVGAGLIGQALLLPAAAVAVGFVFHEVYGLAPALVMGLLLLACCPGGATSNLVTYLARADAALSVTLTSVTSLAAVIMTPLLFAATTALVLGEGERVALSFRETALLVLVVVAIPILLGMAVRRRWPSFAELAEGPFRKASAIFLAALILLLVWQNRRDLIALATVVVPAVLALNALALGAGLLVGRLAKLPVRQSRAIAIEVGFQNATLAITIGLTQLRSPEAALVPGFYSLVMFATGAMVARAWSQDTLREEAAAVPVAVEG